MRNDKKSAYQQKQIEKMAKYIRSLEQEIKSLEQENRSLCKLNESYKKTIDGLQIEHKKALDIYNDGIAEIRTIRNQYKDAIKSAKETEEEFENKMRLLLQQLRK